MFTKRTGIGLGVGGIIIGIGLYALITSIGFQTITIHETISAGDSLPYKITANQNAHQVMTITGEKFDVQLQSPGDGFQLPTTTFTKETTLDWVHLEDGNTIISIQNVGSSEVAIDATLEITTDPILFTYHIIVITSGVVIIGFSMGFSLRRPKGF